MPNDEQWTRYASDAAATGYARRLEGEVEKLRAALAALQTQTGGRPMAAGSMPPRREKRGLGRWFGG